MIAFPVALCAVVLCGVLTTLAPAPAGARRTPSAHEDTGAQAASPVGGNSQLVRVDVPAAR